MRLFPVTFSMSPRADDLGARYREPVMCLVEQGDADSSRSARLRPDLAPRRRRDVSAPDFRTTLWTSGMAKSSPPNPNVASVKTTNSTT
jgi:hypothetical protein